MFSDRICEVIDRIDRLRDEVDDHWQIPRDEAMLLAQLVLIGRCRSICEIGTSYGFSTIHLAAAASEHGGRVHSIDANPKKVRAAGESIKEAGLAGVVTLYEGDVRTVLTEIKPQAAFDFVFIDATKEQSNEYLDAVLDKLAPDCVLVTDNTVTHAADLAPFVARLRGLPGFTSCGVTVGNGFELTVRRS